jgi:hypothetical protein
MQTPPDIDQKRLILLHPDKSFLKQFKRNFTFNKIVLIRKDDPYVFALNEWPNYKILKYPFVVPFCILIIFLAIILAIILIPLSLFSKKLVDDSTKCFFDTLDLIADRNNERSVNDSIDALILNFNALNNDAPFRKILYLHASQKKMILKFNIKKAHRYIDEIWLYNSIQEVYRNCIKHNSNLDYSFITARNEPNVNNKEEYFDCINITWLNNQNENILQEKINKDNFEYKQAELLKPRAPRILLKPNNFLTTEIVYYFESEFHPEINNYLFDNYDRIKNVLEAKGMHFVYIPKLLQNLQIKNSAIIPFLDYEFPDVFKGENELKQELLENALSNIDSKELSESIRLALEIPKQPHPSFLHCVDLVELEYDYRNYSYSVFYLDNINELDKRIDYYLSVVNISRDNADYRLVELDAEDPDEVFDRNKNEISKELSSAIANIKSFNNEKLVIASLIYVIKNLKDSQPALCDKLNKVLYETISVSNQPLSRLLIDDKNRIFLTDYENIEIELTPLPKTLFIFLLKHPEGVKFKELYQHKNELIEIYGQIGNRLDLDQITKSIQDLTDVRTNSINEKCSRIKEAFLSKFEESIARNYYITGARSENKHILLDRSMVVFSETK